MKGYSFYNNPGENKSGGAGLFIKNNINYKIINNYKLNTANCEEIWAELAIPGKKSIIIGSLYRHPSNQIIDFQDNLLKTIETLNELKKHYIIGGDININLLSNKNLVNTYKNELLSQGILQLTQAPTRIQNNQISLLDHIYTNIEDYKFNTKCITFNISDHIPVLTLLHTHKIIEEKADRKIIRDMKKFKYKKFSNDLQDNISKINFNNRAISGDELWETFDDILTSTFNKHAPLKIQSQRECRKQTSPWITNGITKSIKTKQKLYKKAITKTNPLNWTKFKLFRNKLTRTIQEAKQMHYKLEINKAKSNPRKLWKTINNIIKFRKNTNVSPKFELYDTDNSITDDTTKISNIFNKYFVNVGSELSKKITTQTCPRNKKLKSIVTPKNSFFLKPFTIQEIENYIKKLNPQKSTPRHSVPIYIIKQISTIISPIITNIFNICISQGIFPTKLKSAEICPVYKNGDKRSVSNWRPISILSPFSKLFEYHLHYQLTNFLDQNNILHNFQYGFRKNSSTEMAITQICEETIDKLQNNQITCLIFLDLAKAFDCVDHQILLTKLYNYGVRGLPFKLLKNYLTNRDQRTIIKNSKSTPLPITCGVPQGSIMGTLFFNVYINDIINASNFKVRLFADDACLSYSCSDPVNLNLITNNELENINNWRKRNKLTVNFSK